MWVGIMQIYQGQNRTKGRGRRNSPPFSASLFELEHLISSPSALGSGFTLSATLFSGPWTWSELHHQLSQVSTWQTTFSDFLASIIT